MAEVVDRARILQVALLKGQGSIAHVHECCTNSGSGGSEVRIGSVIGAGRCVINDITSEQRKARPILGPEKYVSWSDCPEGLKEDVKTGMAKIGHWLKA